MDNKYEILNRLESNESFQEEVLKEEEKKEIYNRVKGRLKGKKKKRKNIIIAASLSCIVLGTIVVTDESVLASITKVGRSIESFFNKEEGVLKPYKNKIIVENEDQGIKLIVNEVAFDNSEILLSGTIDYRNFNNDEIGISADKDPKIIPREMVQFKVAQNGKEIPFSGTSGSFEYNDDRTVDMLLSVRLDEVDTKGTYAVNLNIVGMDAQFRNNTINIPGKWSVDFEVDGDKMKEDTKVYSINEKREIEINNESITVGIKELRVSPLTMVMEYKYSKHVDKNGVVFKFEDENGNNIDFVNGGGNEKGMSYRYNIDREIKSIKIIPGKAKYGVFGTREKYFEDKAVIVNLE